MDLLRPHLTICRLCFLGLIASCLTSSHSNAETIRQTAPIEQLKDHLLARELDASRDTGRNLVDNEVTQPRESDPNEVSAKDNFLRFLNRLAAGRVHDWRALNPFVKKLAESANDPIKAANASTSLVDVIGSVMIRWIDHHYRH